MAVVDTVRDPQRMDCIFVDREEFSRLAVSCQTLVRWDDAAQHLRGLMNVETGQRYAIREQELFPPLPHRDV